MTAPLVTVVLPTFNGHPYLDRALSSLEPDRDLLQIVAVDSGSTDGTRETLEAARERFRITILDVDGNVSWIRKTNIGIEATTTRWVTILHQDDAWVVGRAATLRPYLEAGDAPRWLFHRFRFIDEMDRELGQYRPPLAGSGVYPGVEILRHLVVENWIATVATVFERSLAMEIRGWDTELAYCPDWDFWLRLCERAPARFVDEALASYRLHHNSMTTQSAAKFERFANELESTVRRSLSHLATVNAGEAELCGRLSAISLAVKSALMAGYAGNRVRLFPLLARFLRIGPWSWLRFFRDSQLHVRVLVRMRHLSRRARVSRSA